MPLVADAPRRLDNRSDMSDNGSQEDGVNISLVSIEKEGLVRLASNGSITAANFDPSGRNPLERILGQNWASFKVLLDMKQTTYIDSSAIGWLIGSHKAFKAAGGVLVLHDIPATIRQMLDLLHVGKVIPITENAQAARELANGGQH
ncbi:MAG: STAS domain-containing protein [Tepidisphaeraceae bacterium]